MSKIDATTLGDAAVGEARKALETVLGANETAGIKKELKTINEEIEKGGSMDKAAIKNAAIKIKTDIEEFKNSENYNKLSDSVKSEVTALVSLSDNLKTVAETIESGGDPAIQKFKAAFEEVVKVESTLSDLNAAQTADLNEMRTKLQSFVASPEDADTKLDSTNFTAFIDTLDTALSKISDQRAKLGASQNRLEYTINNLQVSSENLTAANSRIE